MDHITINYLIAAVAIALLLGLLSCFVIHLHITDKILKKHWMRLNEIRAYLRVKEI